MKYDIRHVTTYRYEIPVSTTRCAVRISPVENAEQKILGHSLEAKPEPIEQSERIGFFGERVTTLLIETAHRELRIEMRAKVDVKRAIPAPERPSPPWEEIRDEALGSDSTDAESPAHYFFPSPMIPILEPLTTYARLSFTAGRPIRAAAADLMARIHKDFVYDNKATGVSTPLAEAFKLKRGVCQDFAHIMVSAMRGLALPAAYVSGYLRTTPPPGKPRLEGADATHAWVDVWCGEAEGWIGFDPTNDILVAENHIVIARGRDYSDVSPQDGVILGSGDQEVSVAVDVVPIEED